MSDDNFDKWISDAIAQKCDIAMLDKLFAMKDQALADEKRMVFFGALTELQGEVPNIIKESAVSFGKTAYKYASIGDIEAIIKPFMVKYELSKRFEYSQSNDILTVVCVITHAAGHSERTTMCGPYDTSGSKNPIQSIASASAYLSRYSLLGALGLTTCQTDDDAVNLTEFISADQVAAIKLLVEQTSTTPESFLGFFKVGSIEEITSKDYAKALSMLKTKQSRLLMGVA